MYGIWGNIVHSRDTNIDECFEVHDSKLEICKFKYNKNKNQKGVKCSLTAG